MHKISFTPALYVIPVAIVFIWPLWGPIALVLLLLAAIPAALFVGMMCEGKPPGKGKGNDN